VPLFSDAGSATALANSNNAMPMHFNLGSDGKGYEAIIIPEGAYRNSVSSKSLEMVNVSKGITRNRMHLILNGIDIFNFSVKEVPLNIQQLLSVHHTFQPEYFVLHQANKIINETIADALHIETSKFPSSLKNFGNTSSASIPVTMVTELSEKLKLNKVNLLLSGFGVGLSWGSVLLTTENLIIPEIINY
jgi:3-oxoacyl-[acyl-carrier-protein] synthase-3